MKNAKKSVLNLIAKVGMKSAINAAGSASSFGYHQIKEPSSIKKSKKTK